MGTKPIEKGSVADDRHFERLCHATKPIPVWEGQQKGKIVEHRKRRRESADCIFASAEIYPVFYSHTGIVLTQDRRGNPHLP
jgi:hypothetical protein